ncbi:MAG: hypothetical protein HFE51_09730 [Clostridia bacterium]|nr:hypothetical protein [Clostridia bacterium]MCI8979785.1 hypothetical protein [Clostridia bacterium]MCI9086681.1 hypothetical protein [Clostridia bacterium]
MNKGYKWLSKFFVRSEEKFSGVDLSEANIFKRILFIVSSNIKSIVVLVCIFAFVSLLVTYTGSLGRHSVVLSLNYEQASKGQNPNLTRYNVYELKSDKVMERVISYAGLQNVITISELADCIDIAENNTGKTIDPLDENTYYISTSYTLSYKHDRHIKNISSEDMMNLICKAYNDMFHEEYVGVKSVLMYDLGDIKDKEYIEIAKLFTNKSDQMLRYIQQRIEENSTYRSEITGQSFQTIKRMIQNVQEYSIKKYYAFALETGLSRDKALYTETLAYKNDILSIKYQKDMIDYNVRKSGVENYDSAMIGTVMVPAVNERMEYYMSRTNIGTDYLTKDADYFLTQGSETNREIIENNDIMAKVAASAAADADYQKAEELMLSVDEELKNVAVIADTTDKDYIKYTTKDYLTFKTYDNSSGKIFILEAVIGSAVVFFIILCGLYYVIDGYIRRKEGSL